MLRRFGALRRVCWLPWLAPWWLRVVSFCKNCFAGGLNFPLARSLRISAYPKIPYMFSNSVLLKGNCSGTTRPEHAYANLDPPPVSPCASEEHREGLGKSPSNTGGQQSARRPVEAHDKVCGSCAGSAFRGGGRGPSPRSHTSRSAGSRAGQRERAKDTKL